MSTKRDRELGMHRRIRRRDFLEGVALGSAAICGAPSWLRAMSLGHSPADDAHGDDPPARTGMRGSHDGSFETAHELRDGVFWRSAGAPMDTRQTYDLAIVGAGVSGLAAAYFYRKAAGPRARILILDNHDDFGGHARRNEMRAGRRTLVGYGGSYAVDSPSAYSPVARGLIGDLGIDVTRGGTVLDRKLYAAMGLGRGVWFDKETFGADKLLPDPLGDFGGECDDEAPAGRDPWPRFMAEAPLSKTARADFRRLCKDSIDYMPRVAVKTKKDRLARMSYARYLLDVAKVDPQVVTFMQNRSNSLYGLGIDAVPAQDAWGLDFPGFHGMKLTGEPAPGMSRDVAEKDEHSSYFFHFPDGNASVARLLVRSLVPGVLEGHTMDDIVTARANYGRLDEATSGVRIRLSSTVMRVRHTGPPAAARDVEVAYVRAGRLETVRARTCILACWNTVIPYICPELPEDQREALAYGTKVPLVYTSVLVRRWTAFRKLGTSAIHAPAGYHSTVNLGRPVTIGDYASPRSPDEPIILHLVRTPCSPGLPARQQYKAGRLDLLGTSFATFERKIRDQLGRMLSPGGFDPARDIQEITVNRWPHGYAYEYNSLFDPFWLEGTEPPCVRARRRWGHIAIANSDAAASAYLDAAIDQAHRAVQEVLAL